MLQYLSRAPGASVGIMMGVRKNGYGIQEFLAICYFEADLKKHVRSPVKQGAGVIMSIVKLVFEDSAPRDNIDPASILF